MTRTNPAALAAAKDLLAQHKKSTKSLQRQKNLDLLWTVLENLRTAGAMKFNLADIGSRLEKMGGPKTQSLRNDTGIAFREVINLYELALKTPDSVAEPDGVERALATMTNATAKHVLREMVTQAKAVARERDQLKIALTAMSVLPPSALSPSTLPPSIPTIPGWVFEAIEFNLDKARLMERGYEISKEGYLQDERETALLGPDFLGAIDQILTLHGKPPLQLRQP